MNKKRNSQKELLQGLSTLKRMPRHDNTIYLYVAATFVRHYMDLILHTVLLKGILVYCGPSEIIEY